MYMDSDCMARTWSLLLPHVIFEASLSSQARRLLSIAGMHTEIFSRGGGEGKLGPHKRMTLAIMIIAYIYTSIGLLRFALFAWHWSVSLSSTKDFKQRPRNSHSPNSSPIILSFHLHFCCHPIFKLILLCVSHGLRLPSVPVFFFVFTVSLLLCDCKETLYNYLLCFLLLFTQPILLVQTKFKVLLGERSEPHTGVFNRDFAWYIYIYVSVVVQNAHAELRGQTRACSRSVWGGLNGPVTPLLFISTIRWQKRNVHLEMRNLRVLAHRKYRRPRSRPHLIDHIFEARITLILLFASLFY